MGNVVSPLLVIPMLLAVSSPKQKKGRRKKT